MSVVTPVLLASVGNTKPTIRWKKLREANVHHHQQQGLNRTLEAKKKFFAVVCIVDKEGQRESGRERGSRRQHSSVTRTFEHVSNDIGR